MCFGLPVLMDIAHSSAPGVDIGWSPVARMEKRMMQLLEPAGEDGVGGLHTVGDGCRCFSSCEDVCTAFLLNELADLGPVEIIQVALSAASSRMNNGDGRECRLYAFLTK